MPEKHNCYHAHLVHYMHKTGDSGETDIYWWTNKQKLNKNNNAHNKYDKLRIWTFKIRYH